MRKGKSVFSHLGKGFDPGFCYFGYGQAVHKKRWNGDKHKRDRSEQIEHLENVFIHDFMAKNVVKENDAISIK
jgi:hypothetical protein